MEYKLIKSDRRTLSLEISQSGEIIVRAPLLMRESDIEKFVKKHETWIKKHLAAKKSSPEPSPEQLCEMKEQARNLIIPKVEYYARKMGLSPTNITITKAKTRFGSCSPKNAVSFSCRLMQYPLEAVDYVVVHELSHIKHHNHGKAFYALIEKYMPDYKSRKKLLR